MVKKQLMDTLSPTQSSTNPSAVCPTYILLFFKEIHFQALQTVGRTQFFWGTKMSLYLLAIYQSKTTLILEADSTCDMAPYISRTCK